MSGYLIPVRDNEVAAFESPTEALEIIVRLQLGYGATADLEVYEDKEGGIVKRYRQGAGLAVSAGRLLSLLRGALFQRLKDGLLSAYVEAPSSGQFYRLPRNYWLNHEQTLLDEPMHRYAEAAGFQDNMEGMPVLLDRDKVAAWGASLQIKQQDTEHAEQDTSLPPAPQPLPRQRGGQQRYDWAGADTALADYDSLEDVIARVISKEITQASVERWMAGWFEQRGGVPATSHIRQRVAGHVQHRREANAARVAD